MCTISKIKLGFLILIVNFFSPMSLVAEKNDKKSTQDLSSNEMRKFIFAKSAKILPNPVITDADGNSIEIIYESKLLVINFWATWCAPCKKEMPSLNILAQDLKGEKIRVITIASGRNSKQSINTFFRENNLTNLTKFRDPKGMMAINYGVTALPTTVVIDSSGVEIGRILGDINWDKSAVKSFLTDLIK